MTEERLINGYRCCFQDSRKAPEGNFVSIPIVHDAKYEACSFSISYTPQEKATFGQRIHLIGFSTHSIKEGYFAVSVFTFMYMEDDDLEFIKKKVEFFFKEKEKENTAREETQTSESKKSELKLRLYSYGDSKFKTIQTIKNYLNMRLSEAKDSIDSISRTGCVNYDLSKLSKTEMQTLLKELRLNNVKFSII